MSKFGGEGGREEAYLRGSVHLPFRGSKSSSSCVSVSQHLEHTGGTQCRPWWKKHRSGLHLSKQPFSRVCRVYLQRRSCVRAVYFPTRGLQQPHEAECGLLIQRHDHQIIPGISAVIPCRWKNTLTCWNHGALPEVGKFYRNCKANQCLGLRDKGQQEWITYESTLVISWRSWSTCSWRPLSVLLGFISLYFVSFGLWKVSTQDLVCMYSILFWVFFQKLIC